jgi:ribose transport system substrate-binding protein
MTKGFSKARVPGPRWRALVVATVVAGAAAGCGSSTSSNSNVSSSASSSASATGAASTFPQLKPPTGSNSATGLRNKTVGLVIITQASEVFPQQQKAMKEAFAQLGWNIKLADLQGDISKVPATVENLLQSGVDAIVLQSVEPSFVGQQAAAMAKAKGVPIIGQETGVPTAASHGIIQAAVESPFEAPAKQEGAAMVASEGKGSKAAFIIDQLASTGRAAQKGVQAGIAGQLDAVATHQLNYAKLVPDVTATVQQWLVQHPDLKAIWCPYDGACVGAGEAVKASGKHVSIWSLDGTPTAFKLIREGVDYTTWAFPLDYLNWLTTDVIVSELAKRPVDPATETLPTFKIDKSNVPSGDALSGTLMYGDFKRAFEKRWGVGG